MASITTSLDATYLRVGVSLAAWTTDGPVDVYRVHTDGSRNLVRGMSAVSGGVAFGWDYETPLSVPITYEAWNGATLVVSSATTFAAPSSAVLTIPGLPSFGGGFTVRGKVAPRRPRPTATLSPIGRVNPIVKSDVMKAPAFTLSVRTYTDADAYRLTATLAAAATFLLRIPGTRVTDWCYISIGNVDEQPVVHFKSGLAADTAGVGAWADWSIDCQVVGTPAGGVFGDPTATFQASLDAYPTFAARLAAHATFIDALRG